MGEWVDRTVLEAMSWRLASELVRRHPATRVLHTHPGGGQYDCLTIVSRSGGDGTLQLNRAGTIQVHARFDGQPVDLLTPMEWDEYVRSDPREFLDRLERAAGLCAPLLVPSAGPTTLTYRVLAAFAMTAAKTVHPIEIQSGFIDTSGYGGGPNTMLDAFSAISAELRRSRDDDLLNEPGYRFWIVLREGLPILAVEQEVGLAWTKSHVESVDLLDLYRRSDRSVLMVALELLRWADDV